MCNVYIFARQNVRQAISVALLWSSFWSSSLAGHADFLLVFLQWVCIAYSTVGSTGNVDGVNLSLDISALFLYILHVLAFKLAGTLIVVVASCCCWLATHVQKLMHTW